MRAGSLRTFIVCCVLVAVALAVTACRPLGGHGRLTPTPAPSTVPATSPPSASVPAR